MTNAAKATTTTTPTISNAVQHQEQDNNGSENDIGNLPSTAAAVALVRTLRTHTHS